MSYSKNKMTCGFNDWKHAHETLSSHENSKAHRDAMSAICLRKSSCQIDKALIEQFEKDVNYWNQVFQRTVSVIKFLCVRGLAFRGKDELVGSPHNGNYLGLLELISQHDPFLAEHIRLYANKGRGHASYLSSTICEEIIELMGQKVLSVIFCEMKSAKYFSISVDSTPDITHVDQLTVTCRYVQHSGPIERFLKFIPMYAHTGSGIAEIILNFFEENGIDIKNCRGQSYDNASNMSGKYNGVQSIIREKCSAAHYVPCTAHSLNLVGKNAAECCTAVVDFFDLIQSLYSWFVASTHRWNVHKTHLGGLPVSKALSDTRWSARHDAVHALNKGYDQTISALEELASDDNQPPDSRCEAEGFSKKLKQLETAILLQVWGTLLERFQKTSLSLQSSQISLNTAIELLNSLSDYIKSQRDEFHKYEQMAIKMSGFKDYKEATKRRRTKKFQFDDDASTHTTLSPRDHFRSQVFVNIIDLLCSALKTRIEAYQHVHSLFGFLNDLCGLDSDNILRAATNLVKAYPNDFEESLGPELIQFAKLFKMSDTSNHVSNQKVGDSVEVRMLRLLNDFSCTQTFPNVHIALRIYLCMMASNCSGERSFSKLKRIKNELRSTMRQERLTYISLMSIEHELLSSLSFQELMEDFARRKIRKRPM